MKDKNNHKEEIRKELDGLSPLLSRLKKEQQDDFPAPPEGYFKNFEEKLKERLKDDIGEPAPIEEDQPQPMVRPLMYRLMAVAAAVLLVFGVWNQMDKPEESCELACLTLEEIDAYVNANLDDIDTETIIENIDEETIDELASELSFIETTEEEMIEEETQDIKEEEIPSSINFDEISDDELNEFFEEGDFEDEDFETIF